MTARAARGRLRAARAGPETRGSAAAFRDYGDAARLQMLLEVLPDVADALAKPLGSISDLTVISNDGAGQLSRSVAGNLHATIETVRRTTGLDLVSLLGSRREAPAAVDAAVGRGSADGD